MTPDSIPFIQGVSKVFAGAIGIIGAIFGFGVAWGISQAKTKQNRTDINQIKKDCPVYRDAILKQVCEKIDKVYVKLDEMNKSREEARVEFAELVGRMERKHL